MKFLNSRPTCPRPPLVATAAFCLSTAFAHAADSVVVFNEINYHPAAAAGTEWIELRNLMGVNVDISGWRLAEGTDYTFPKGTVIAGHGFLLVAADPANAGLAGKGALGPLKGALNNSGETLQLRNNSDRIMDEVTYSDSGDWPAGPDGGGPTLAKRDQGSADSQASNWTASPEQGGTPGAANFPIQGQVPVTSTLVSLDTVWKYRAEATAPDAGWNATAYNDTAWPSGQAALYSGTATVSGAGEGLLAWWPLNETSGTVAANSVTGGQAGTLVNGPVWTADPVRGRVLSLQGASDYVSTGSALIPVMTLTNQFTWSFWAKSNEGSGTSVVLGNRYNPSGAEWNPREFLKFTASAFEYHSNGAGQNVDYSDFPTATWVHHAVVKSGATLTYYRNGTASGSSTITQGTSNPQPFYFGGDKASENWSGSLDDVALWTRALPASSVAGLASGTFTPLSAPTDPNGGGSLKTQIPGGTSAHYFRKAFTFTGAPSLTTLTLKHLTDDGAVFYLNGTEISRFNLPAGAVTHTTAASPEVVNASLSAAITVPGTLLRSGANVLAVEVHQDSPASPDMVFAASLEGVEQPPSANTPLASVVFNEISSASDPDFRVELTNTSSQPVDLTGWLLKSSAGPAYTFPAATIQAGGFLTVNAATLGFTPISGDKLFLLTAGDGTFCDARGVTNRLRGRLNGRWLYPNAPTFGAANTFSLNENVVINEIMYNPRPLEAQTDPPLPFRNSDEQWVELYNRGAAAVNLSGWSFSQGITFAFPAGATLPAGGYLIVARDAASMAAKHPGIPIAGQFTGSLARSGEMLRLDDAAGNPADEVSYSDGGRWPGTPDGGGSSLELRDPRSDNHSPGSWSASNEAARRVWQTYTYTARATNGQNDPTQYNEFIFGLLDSGDILLDDISVIEDPATTARELIQNGNFTGKSLAGWRFLGTHSHVEAIDDPENPNNQVLHLQASGATEHMHNHAETTLKNAGAFVTINSAKDYKISFRAKWLSGSNALNTRLYFNRAAAVTKLAAQPDGGTPGAANSTFTANAGPVLNQLTHSPAVPAAGAPVTVSVNAADPDGLNVLTIFYSVNDSTTYSSAPMTAEDGGRFSGTIPGQAAGTKIQFYVSAEDNSGAVSLEPSGGTASRAMIPWQDGQANLDYGPVQPNNFRIVMTTADANFMHTNTQVMSNDRVGCTVIYNESEIYYDCGVRLKGSERGRPQDVRVGFNVSFPDDHLFLGAHGTVSIDRSGAGDQFSQKEIMVKHAAARAGGIPSMNDDLIRVIAPKSAHTGSAMLLKSRFDNEWLDNQFENGSDGRMFEFELIYYPTTTTGGVEGLKLPNPDDVRGVDARTLGGLGKELYRWHWLIDTNRDADDYSGIISMLQTFTKTGTAYNTELPQKVDVDEWLRSFAIQTLFGIGDSYSSGSQHNLLVYFRPDDGKAMYFPWDMDFTFDLAATSGVLNNADLNKMIAASPANFRSYYGQLEELCGTVFNSAYMTP
ncbi:MAG: lamin tail domain-containing protein [Verrucomicrobiota bacterium]